MALVDTDKQQSAVSNVCVCGDVCLVTELCLTL